MLFFSQLQSKKICGDTRIVGMLDRYISLEKNIRAGCEPYDPEILREAWSDLIFCKEFLLTSYPEGLRDAYEALFEFNPGMGMKTLRPDKFDEFRNLPEETRDRVIIDEYLFKFECTLRQLLPEIRIDEYHRKFNILSHLGFKLIESIPGFNEYHDVWRSIDTQVDHAISVGDASLILDAGMRITHIFCGRAEYVLLGVAGRQECEALLNAISRGNDEQIWQISFERRHGNVRKFIALCVDINVNALRPLYQEILA